MPNDPRPAEPEGHADRRSQVQLVRVAQHGTRHDFEEWTLAVVLTGGSGSMSSKDDVAKRDAAQTIENTVYGLARQSNAESIEEFARELTQVLLSQSPHSTAAEVSIASHLWKRLAITGEPHPAAFMKGSDERQTTRVTRSREGSVTITSGFREMTLLRVASAGLANQITETTGLRSTPGGPLSITIMAEWQYNLGAISADAGFNKLRHRLRERMIAAFASLDSINLQETLEALAEAAVQQPTGGVEEIVLRATNRTLLPVPFSPGDRGASNQVFVRSEADQGTIEVRRTRAHPG